MFLVKFIKFSMLGLFILGALTAGVAWLPSAGADPVASNGLPKDQPAQKKPEKPNSDQERIQGTWIVDSVKATDEPKTGGGGRRGRGPISPKPWSAAKGTPINFSEDRVEFGWFTGAANFFRLDSAHEPKRIDFIARNETSPGFGPGARPGTRVVNTTRPSIYKFDGDKLLIALGDDELRERPESFEWKDKRTPFVLLVLRRPDESERRKLEQAEHEYLQGTWICVMETVKGERRQIPRDKRDDVKLVVKGDRLRFDTPGNDPLHATFSLNLTEYPWQIDLKATADWGKVTKGATIAGIFSEQNSVVTLALGTVGRPSSFAAAGKDGTVYVLVSNNLSFNPSLEWLEPLTEEKPAIPEAKRAAPQANKRIRELQAERVEALKEQLQGQFERVQIGKDPLIQYIEAVRELGAAEYELAETQADRIKTVERMVKELQDCEQRIKELMTAGLSTKQHVAEAKAARLKAEIELEKLKTAK